MNRKILTEFESSFSLPFSLLLNLKHFKKSFRNWFYSKFMISKFKPRLFSALIGKLATLPEDMKGLSSVYDKKDVTKLKYLRVTHNLKLILAFERAWNIKMTYMIYDRYISAILSNCSLYFFVRCCFYTLSKMTHKCMNY